MFRSFSLYWVLRISSGKVPGTLSQENVFFIGDKEVEFDRVLPIDEYISGACFSTRHSSFNQASSTVTKTSEYKPLLPLGGDGQTNPTSNPVQSRLALRDIVQLVSTNIEQLHWKANL